MMKKDVSIHEKEYVEHLKTYSVLLSFEPSKIVNINSLWKKVLGNESTLNVSDLGKEFKYLLNYQPKGCYPCVSSYLSNTTSCNNEYSSSISILVRVYKAERIYGLEEDHISNIINLLVKLIENNDWLIASFIISLLLKALPKLIMCLEFNGLKHYPKLLRKLSNLLTNLLK